MNGTAHNNRRRSLLRGAGYLFVVILVMLFCIIGISARTEVTQHGEVTMYAEINEKNTEEIRISFLPDEAFLKAKKGETLYLFTLQPQESTENLRTKSPTATKVVEKSTVFTVTADAAGERYRAKYVLALGMGADYSVVGEAYVINSDVLADNTAPRTEAGTIKGLVVSGALASDAQVLGIGHAVIPVAVDQYVTAKAGDPAFSEATAGQPTHFDPTKIRQLDALVASLQDSGVRILFRFMLDGSDRGTTEPAAALYASTAADGASGYGFTMETKLAYQTINNVFTYFSERYAAVSDTPIDFLVGYQVNEWVNWYNLGYSSEQLTAQVTEYAQVFRLAEQALRAQSANSRVYVPLSNLWATARPFLSAFAAEMGTGAAWSVAAAPYASDPLDDSIWDDRGASQDEYTTYLTMTNLGILKTYLSQEQFLYGKQTRAVIIDDFAIHGTSGDTASQERQAASFVYAYYAAAEAEFIEAMIWHRIIDGAGEQCSLGLRQLDESEKPVYTLFRLIDSQLGSDAAETYSRIAGERKWSSLIRGFSKKQAETVRRYETEGTDADISAVRADTLTLLDFADRDLHGFQPTEYAASAEISSVSGAGTEINASIMTVQTHPMTSSARAGLTTDLGKAVIPEAATTLYITLKVTPQAVAPAPNADGSAAPLPQTPETIDVQLLLNGTGDTDIRYLGTASVDADSWTTLAFDIKGYARAADSTDLLRLLVGGSFPTVTDSSAQYTYTISVNDLRYETGAGLLVLRVFIGIMIVLATLVVIFALLVLRAQIIRRRRRRQRAAQRAAYLARQRQQQMMAQRAMQQNVQQPPAQMPQNGDVQNVRRRTAQRRPDMYPGTGRDDRNRR